MKIKKILSLILACLITAAAGFTSYAEESLIGDIVIDNETDGTVETTTGEISFYFEPEGYVTERRIFTALILKYGVSAESFYENGTADDVAAIMQSSLDGGRVSFSANIIEEPSGAHTIIVSYGGAVENGCEKVKQFKYINPERLDKTTLDIILQINEAIAQKDKSKIADVFESEADVKAVSELYAERILNAEKDAINTAAGIIADGVEFKQSDGRVVYGDIENFVAAVNRAFAIAEINMADSADRVKSALEFYNKDYYKIDSDFSEENADEIFSLMCRKPVKSESEVNGIYKYAKIKTEFIHTNYSLIYDTVKKYAEEIDGINKAQLDGISNKDNFGRYFLNGIESCGDLKAMASLINGYSESKDSGGGSSGGGKGSGSSSGGSVNIGADIVKNVQTKKEKAPLFSDVAEDHWAFPGIEYLYGKGAIRGYDDGSFKCSEPVTRAEFVKMAAKVFDIAVPEEENVSFNDVSAEDWFYESVKAAAAAGLVLGDSDGRFNPDKKISRQEIAVILNRCLEKSGKNPEKVNETIIFSDADSIANWAFESVIKLQQTGIINGNDDGSFKPEDNASRAESAMMLYRLMTAKQKSEEGDKLTDAQ